VFGTIGRQAVATGAELVSYGGFTAGNHFRQAYNPELDFGTSDICMMAWVKTSDGYGVLMDRTTNVSNTGRLILATYPNPGSGNVQAGFGGYSTYSSKSVNDNEWHHIVGVRRYGSCVEVYIDGVLDTTNTATGAITADIDGSANKDYTEIGVRNDGAQNLSGQIALLRVSGTAPTAEQIAKIYEDEKVLFQEGAQATLYGSSDAVTALAYDDTTDLLHVGTSAGRSDFSGLRRVSNTTDAVGTAISASNGMIVEE
jgi:hypothetical protein